MYGGSHKFARGGGARGGASVSKRNSFPPPPPQRPSFAARPSHSSRKPPPPSSSSASPAPETTAPPQSEESFTLIPCNPLSFAATIRLAPDLVDEIKRVESQGGAARIKFDSNPNNPPGNVIDVGGKEYRFTWSHEMGGLCDIYEERQSGEDGNGLLVESGCAWRKLNVQRVLDESTKKQVKKRSEEYEQKLKSRKAIVLDQCNPPMKSQMQAFAAAEVNPWKFKPKNRRLSEPSQVGGPPKPVKSTTGSSLTATAKGRRSTSPLPSPQNQPVSVASSLNRGNATESQIVAENSIPNQARDQENAVSSVNDVPASVSGRVPESAVHKENQGAGISDLQNYLVTLLKENPKGMSIKALEKAVGDTTSLSVRKIEPILKKIATYEPPGRYILKSAVEQESLKKSYFDNGSSDDNNQKFVPEDNLVEVSAPDLRFAEKSPAMDVEEQVQTVDEESNMVEKIDASQHFSDLFGYDEPPVNNEGQTVRSNDSKSDSDSDSGSSDSGSDSASRSRSPAGSGSASSSDSEGDDSSSASDVDVDIISDDDKEPKNLQGTEQDGGNIDQDGYVSEDVDIGTDFLDDNESQLATVPQNLGIITEKMIASDHDQTQPCNRADVVTEQEDVIDDIQPENHDFVKSGGKSKRGSNEIQFEHDADHVKRFKANPTQPTVSRHIESHNLGSSPNHSADLMSEDIHESHNVQKPNQFSIDEGANTNLGVQSGYNYVIPGKSAVESLQSGRGPAARLGVDSKLQKTNDYTQLTQDCFSKYDKGFREAQDEEDSSNEKANGKFKENPLAQKSSVRPEPHHRKHSEWDNKAQSLGTSSRLRTGFSLKDNGKAEFDRSPGGKRLLQRELSDLELGELRDPLPEESEESKRQFERISSFKKSETKSGTSGSQNPDLRSKSTGKPVIESGNTSFPNARGAPNNSDSLSKIRSPEPYVEDGSRPHGDLQSQLQQSRSGHAEVGSFSNKAVDRSRLGHNADVANQETEVEGYGVTHKKSHVHSQREDSRQEMGSRKGRGNKSRKSNIIKSASDLTKKKKDASDLTKKKKDASGRRRDVPNTQGGINKRKRSESFSDDSFYKYEKEEPELKEPVKNFSQYNEYVQEYCEKYEPYSSLIKILERYRMEFQKMGMELERAKGTGRYDEILAQIRESFRRCEMRYKRLKKIFLVLHEEMKHLRQMIEDFYLDYNKGRI
ncbi:uncharacterized protein LOC110699589 [Chenopodium quinoa]|uniref:uncharacterized protein LOC110699589 n=1 Tax=Chenopodium quinoa TaxID=63459 RepID=UPI000B78D6E1|nr:uncharacterized protein LOC110699589 [Chenopodium quinoa]